MNKRNVRSLAIACIALAVVLVVLQTGKDDTSTGGSLLFPELKADINSITRVSVTRAGEDEATVISREADSWVVTSRDDYAADIGILRELLLALADAKLVERKTSNPDLHSELGLRDPAVEGSKGILLELQGAASEYRLIIGNAAQGGYRYARIADDPQSWLIDRNPRMPESPGDWLLDNIIDLKSAQVRSVTIAHPDGEEIHISKESPDATDFGVLNVPDGRELSYATVANGIAGALNALTLDDVRKANEVAADAVTTTFDTFGGVRVIVNTLQADDENWISLRAEAAEQAPAADTEGEAGNETAQEDEATDEAEEASGEGVESPDAINARVAGWQYKIPDYKANQLTRRFDDILKAETE